jgi:hypothetical protein
VEDGRGLPELSGDVHDDTAILELKSDLRGYRRLVAPVQVIAHEVDGEVQSDVGDDNPDDCCNELRWGVDQQLPPCATSVADITGRQARSDPCRASGLAPVPR